MYPNSPRSSQVSQTTSIFSNREVTYAQLPPAEYHQSQRQCIEQLQQYKSLLMQNQTNITLTMENFYKNLQALAHRQHQKVRIQLMRILDESFEKNWSYLSQAIIFQGEPSALAATRQRIASVSSKIAQLQMGLRTANYKPYIAQVVTSNFDGVIEQINTVILSTKQMLSSNAPSILIDREKIRLLSETVNTVLIFNPTQTPINQLQIPQSFGYQMSQSPRGKSPISPRVSGMRRTKMETTETINFN